MKKAYLISLIFILSISVHAQTKIDELVLINIPGEVSKLDTIVQNYSIKNFVSHIDNATYLVQKLKIDDGDDDLNDLPSNTESLRKSYNDCIKGFAITMKEGGYIFSNSSEFKRDDYIFFKASFSNAEELNKKVVESNFLILNENAYVLSYFNNVDFNEKNKEDFMNSIKIASSLKPSQTIGKGDDYKLGYMAGTITCYLFVLGGILFLYFKFRKKRPQ